MDNLKELGLFKVGSKLYGVCNECSSLVRIDKPIIGSLHICAPNSLNSKDLKGRGVCPKVPKPPRGPGLT